MEHAGERHLAAGLSVEEIRDVRRLLEICNRHESLELPISSHDLRAETDIVTGVLYGERGALIGFASIPDDPVPEACLMVHPDHRRRGIGSRLVTEIRSECRRRGLPGCLVVIDQASGAAAPFLAALEIPYRSSEFLLELDRAARIDPRPRPDGLTMRPASAADRETLVNILAAAFAESAEVAASTVDAGLAETKRRFYVAELAGKPIGTLRAGEWDGFGDITAFGVAPEHQGRGYGRQMLVDVVALLTAAGLDRIRIEVETGNSGALGLYESCGFRVQREYGYFWLATA